ncbi:MAG: hypothetical protein LBL93_07205 [Ruminococcus sp.]|nr:hypothetical protein [Ruminococcus sp.]
MNTVIEQENFGDYGIGNRARNLFVLRQNKISTPNFFCISANFLDEYMRERKVKIGALLSSASSSGDGALISICSQIKQLMHSLNGDNEFVHNIRAALKKGLPGVKKINILPSVEIDPKHENFLYKYLEDFKSVNTFDLVRNLVRCFGTIYKPEIVRYFIENNIPLSALRVNIIVQEVLEARHNGVFYTANPDGIVNENKMLIGYGDEEKILEAGSDVTKYYYNTYNKKVYFEAASNSPLLEDDLREEIFAQFSKLPEMFGKYLTVSFIIYRRKPYITNITYTTGINEDNFITLDSKGVHEKQAGITTPLTETITSRIHTAALYSFGNLFFSNNSEFIINYRDELAGAFRSANGRMYVNLTSFSVLLDTLKLSKGVLKDIGRIFNIDDISKIKSGLGENVSFLTRVKSTFNYRRLFFKNDIMMSTLKKDLSTLEIQTNLTNLLSLTNEQLQELFNETVRQYTDMWGKSIWNNLVSIICSRKVRKALSGIGISDPITFIQPIYLSATLESSKPFYHMLKLAKTAIDTYSVDRLEDFSSDSEVLDYLYNNENDEFVKAFKEYVSKYGDFSGMYYKFETETYKKSALNLVKDLLAYAKNASLLNSTLESLNVQKIDFRLPPGLGIRKFAMNFYLKRLRSSLANAQSAEQYKIRAYGFLRKIIDELGFNFVKTGKLKNAKEIYYLTLSEVFALIDVQAETDKASLEKYATIIVNRQRDYERFGALPEYTRIIFSNGITNKACANLNKVEKIESASTFVGLPCSDGKVSAEAIVTDEFSDTEIFRNKILVTSNTSSGILEIMPILAGLVTEKGTLLSNSSVKARELGLPTIIDVENITEQIKSGDIISVNGENGKIEIVKKFENDTAAAENDTAAEVDTAAVNTESDTTAAAAENNTADSANAETSVNDIDKKSDFYTNNINNVKNSSNSGDMAKAIEAMMIENPEIEKEINETDDIENSSDSREDFLKSFFE